jgi:hypothetical protein
MSAHALRRLVNAVGEMATKPPSTLEEATFTVTDPCGAAFTVTDSHGSAVGAPVHLAPLPLRWLGQTATYARADADRSHLDHPLHGWCAWCHPDPLNGHDHHSLVQRAADAIGKLVTDYPTGHGFGGTLHLTEADGTRHGVPLRIGHAEWLADLVQDLNSNLGPENDPDLGDDQCPHCGEIMCAFARFDAEDDPEHDASLTLAQMLSRLADLCQSTSALTGPDWGVRPTMPISPASFLNSINAVARPARTVKGLTVPESCALAAPVIDTDGTRWAGQHWTRPAPCNSGHLEDIAEHGHYCDAFTPEPYTDNPVGGLDDCANEFIAGVAYHEHTHPYPRGRLYVTHVWCPQGHHDDNWSSDLY